VRIPDVIRALALSCSVLGNAAPLSAQCIGVDEAYGWDLWWATNCEDFVPYRAAEPSDHDGAAVRAVSADDVRNVVIPVLLGALKDGDARVRDRAAVAIGKCGDAREVPELLKMLSDRNRAVVAAAILGLGLLAQPAAEEALARMLANPQVQTRDRALAALALGLSGGVDARKPLFDDLGTRYSHPIECARVLAAALWAGADKKDGNNDRTPLAARLIQRSLENPAVRDRAFQNVGTAALSKTRDRGSLPFVLGALADRREDIKAAAANAAGRVIRADDKKSVAALIRALRSEAAPWPKRMMVIALGRIGGPEAIKELAPDLDHADPQHRAFTVLALGIAGARELAPRLRQELMGFTADRNKGAIAIALGLMNDEAAGPLVAELLARKNSGGDLTAQCMWFFALRRSRDAVPLIQGTMENTRVQCVHERAATALGVIGAVEAQPLLVKLMREEPSEVASAAAVGLGRMGDRGALEALLRIATSASEVDTTRAAAVAGLGVLAQRDPWSAFARVSVDSPYDPQNDAIDEICWRAGKPRIIYGQNPRAPK
jgi:HEAT repeat protein